ncbi:MAG: hypothetical protein ACM3JI_05800, partial [Anaerolineae bacterium]
VNLNKKCRIILNLILTDIFYSNFHDLNRFALGCLSTGTGIVLPRLLENWPNKDCGTYPIEFLKASKTLIRSHLHNKAYATYSVLPLIQFLFYACFNFFIIEIKAQLL